MRSAIPSLNNTSLSISLMIGAIFCFASMDAVAKYLMQEIGPVQTIWARYTVQAVLVTVLILPRINIYGKTRYPKLQFFRSVALMLATTLFFFAFSRLGLAEATALFNISPVLITLGAFLFLKEKIGPKRIIGIGVSLVGALIIIRPGSGVFTIYALFPIGERSVTQLTIWRHALLVQMKARGHRCFTLHFLEPFAILSTLLFTGRLCPLLQSS